MASEEGTPPVEALTEEERINSQEISNRNLLAVTQDESSDPGLFHDGVVAQLARNKYFENITLFVISLNAVWIGIDMENNKASIWTEAHPVFQVADNFFCFFFSFEVVVRFFAFRHKTDFWKDKSFCFDAALVLLMIVETWVIVLIAMASGASGGGGLKQLSVLRLLRMLRLTRMARLMRFMPELMTLAKGLVKAIRSVTTTFVFLIGIIWVFAIIFHIQYKEVEGDLRDLYFSRIGIAMVTLFVNGTLLDELTSVGYLLVDDSMIMLAVFLGFVLLSSLTVLNMLIGILSDVVGKTAAEETQNLAASLAEDMLRDVFTVTDQDGSGKVNREEFEELIADRNSPACKALFALGIAEDRLSEACLQIFLVRNDENHQPHSSSLPSSASPAEKPPMKAWTSTDDPVSPTSSRPRPAGKELTLEEFMSELKLLQPCEAVSVRDLSTLRRATAALSKRCDEAILSAIKEIRSCATSLIGAEETAVASVPNPTANSQANIAAKRKLSSVPTNMLLNELTVRMSNR